jgi:hypothetical protein
LAAISLVIAAMRKPEARAPQGARTSGVAPRYPVNAPPPGGKACHPAGGEPAVICVSLSTVNAAALAPNMTEVAPVKFLPVIVTVVPPAAGPLFGSRLLMKGRVPDGNCSP